MSTKSKKSAKAETIGAMIVAVATLVEKSVDELVEFVSSNLQIAGAAYVNVAKAIIALDPKLDGGRTIYGVLTDMVNCIRELVLDGNAVKIPNLAIFSAGLTTAAASTPEAFKPSANIKSVHLRARSTGDLTRAVLTTAAKVQQLVPYDPSKGAVETETPTDPDGKSVNP